MSRRSRLHYTLTTIGYGASRMKARLPRSTCLLGDSLSFGAADRYKLPSHTTSRQNQPPQPRSLGSIRAIAFRSWLPPIGPIKDSPLQSLRHARRNSGRGSAALPASLHFSKSNTGLRLRRYLTELRSTRKPRLLPRSPGVLLRRSTERQKSERPLQPPPRLTRPEPDEGPVGSVTEPLG